MTRRDQIEERALEVARDDFTIEVPPGHAAAVARAALAAAPAPRPWWELALPVAWRAAVAANVIAAALLGWLLLREPARREPTGAPSRDATLDVDRLLDAEADRMLARALGLGEVAP
jgi:hypothetical protein